MALTAAAAGLAPGPAAGTVAGSSGGPAPATSISMRPDSVTVSGSSVYVGDGFHNVVLAFSPSTGTSTRVAGNGTYGMGGDGGLATDARLTPPEGLAVDAKGNLYIAHIGYDAVRRVDASTGIISTVLDFPLDAVTNPAGLAFDPSGNMYVVESQEHVVERVDPTGRITTAAGSRGAGSGGDGLPATLAELKWPWGLAIDSAGNLYIADTNNQRVRRVDALTGIITTVAGNGTAGFSGDGGPATSAQLNRPKGIAVDGSGRLYIADADNQRIRRVDPSGPLTPGTITTVAGTGAAAFSGDGGPATSAQLNRPQGIAIDGSGRLYIADTENNRLRRIDAGGTITTVAGTGSTG